jgi:hypothetical protein
MLVRISQTLATAHKIVLLVLLLVPFCAAASNDRNYQESHDAVRDFVSAGALHVRLKVGDVRIIRGDADKIRLHYTVKSDRESRLKDAHLEFDVSGRNAEIEINFSHSGNTEVDMEIEVPQNTDVGVRNKVGEVTVKEIQGDKDLEVGVGDIRVEAERNDYRSIHASAGIGDVSSSGYGESTGWLGKTLRYSGEGKYELKAKVGVGDIKLEGK